MTCKIDRHVTREDPVVLRICGRITGENVNTLRSLLEKENGTFTIDLEDVRLVDDEAVRLLAIHESNGARIDHCPLYIREWITREREAMRA
jgi:anti-anti-sigma regulatory factor